MGLPKLVERPVEGSNFVFFGGSAGIGQAAALALAERGASVLIVARGEEEGEATVARALAAGAASADFLQADLSTLAGIMSTGASVRRWRPSLHGVVHSAITPLKAQTRTVDGLDLPFAVQYLSRALLNRLLLDSLVYSGDGRVVHIAGDVSGFIEVDLDDLQFNRRSWSFTRSVFGAHVLGALHVKEASRRWTRLPVCVAMSCVGNTKSKAMTHPGMPWWMRMMGAFGGPAHVSARNAVRLLTAVDVTGCRGTTLRSPSLFKPEPIERSDHDATRLWEITSGLMDSPVIPVR